jgi:hypothetical protein
VCRVRRDLLNAVLVNNQQFFFYVYLFQFSTCFEHRCAHHLFFFFFFFFSLRRYNFREVLAFSTSFFHLFWFLMQSFQFVIFILVISLFTSPSHLFLGLPSDLVSAGDHSYTFFYHAVIWHTMYVSEPS